MEYLKGYDDIVCELALCTFNLVISQQKESACKKNNKLGKMLVYICLLYVPNENQGMLMQ